MILYFSGTGNSAFAAKFIGEAIDDQVLDLFDKIRNNDYSSMESKRPWVIAAPDAGFVRRNVLLAISL